jgi:hypothetical protein
VGTVRRVVTRAGLWLPLLRRLTESAPSWAVWKSPESAFHGSGDIDAVASKDDWMIVIRECRLWARERSLGPLVLCTHVPELLILAACEGDGSTALLQMDVYSHHVFRGARLDVRNLRPLMRLDERGFRRLRPGAEGLQLLLERGIGYGGTVANAYTAERIAELLREDPEGVEQTAAILGARGRHALAAARGLAAGGWDRREVILLELRSVARLLQDPRDLSACLVRDARRLRRCLVIRTLQEGRRVSGDLDQWLEQVRQSHTVYEPSASDGFSNES